MANPQREDGHIDIAHEIAEQLAKINLNAYEWRTLWALWRKTWGWHKKIDKISITQFQKATGLKRRHQARALKALIDKNIVTYKGNSFIYNYGFQKDYTKWKLVTYKGNNSETVTYIGNSPLPIKVTNSLPIKVPTKENKETIQKKATSSYFTNPLFKSTWEDWLEVRKKLKAPNTERALQLALNELNKYPIDTAIKMLEQSIGRGWRGIFPLKKEEQKQEQKGKGWL